MGRLFPTVEGKRLDGRAFTLPDDAAGEPALLMVGYRQSSQFDIDRWLLGLHEAGVDVPVYELPTIPGMLPRLFSRNIDNGMRSGIPEEDWAVVITIYRDANEVIAFLGKENPLPARVVLLDAQGRVSYFHDRGYSVAALMALRDALSALHEETMASPTDEMLE